MNEVNDDQQFRPARRMVLGAALVGGAALTAGVSSTPAVATPPSHGRRPVTLTTDEMIDRARGRVASGEEPWAEVWSRIAERADEALTRAPAPYQGPSYDQHYAIGKVEATFCHDLALAYRITDDDRYATAAREHLLAWAAAQRENEWPDSFPASDGVPGAGMVIARVLTGFVDAYCLVWSTLTTEDRSAIAGWFASLVAPIKESQRIWAEEPFGAARPPYANYQYFNNHLSAYTAGLTLIGYATKDNGLVKYALEGSQNERNLRSLINGAIFTPADIGTGNEGDVMFHDQTRTADEPLPEPGEMYDRYRTADRNQGNGINYCFLNLKQMLHSAEAAYNNNYPVDWYAYVGEHGEKLDMPLNVYSKYVISGDVTIGTGYYRRDTLYGHRQVYELASRHYPDNGLIDACLGTSNRISFDSEGPGYATSLTHGRDVNWPPTAWE
ncbi:alginate lyase family protein [Ruania alba]|uniref:Alginate lyase n=1 Tax=Ruania alba TaxID=648782 RepID=A0A1H5L245_9MICO|nr:alginate lyase family protein [Ruania alba]SEE71152.1 Alginate lyase [Ruania alba]